MNTSLLILSIWAVLLAWCQAGRPRGIGLISRGLFCSDIQNKWIHAWLWLSLSIPSLIWSPYSSPGSLSLSLSAALVKRHAPIKCLPFQLFSSHVILLLDYNPHLPPLGHPPPSLPVPAPHTGSQRLYSPRTGSIACNVFCHLSYATAWLTWLRLIKSLLASVAHCSERVQPSNSLSLSGLSMIATQRAAHRSLWVKPDMTDMVRPSSLITVIQLWWFRVEQRWGGMCLCRDLLMKLTSQPGPIEFWWIPFWTTCTAEQRDSI